MAFARSRLVALAAGIVAASILFAPPAHAYLDPGTGSYVFQMLIAVALSAAFTIKHYWKSLKTRLRRLAGRGDAEQAPGGE